MSCVKQVFLIDVYDAVSELEKLGYVIDDDDCIYPLRERLGNGAVDWGFERPARDRAVGLLEKIILPESWEDVAYLAHTLLLTPEERDCGRVVYWRISW